MLRSQMSITVIRPLGDTSPRAAPDFTGGRNSPTLISASSARFRRLVPAIRRQVSRAFMRGEPFRIEAKATSVEQTQTARMKWPSRSGLCLDHEA